MLIRYCDNYNVVINSSYHYSSLVFTHAYISLHAYISSLS